MHLHHLLQDRGLSNLQTLVVLSILALFGGVIGLASHWAGFSDGPMFTLFVLLGAVYFFAVRRLTNSAQQNKVLQQAQESSELS